MIFALLACATPETDAPVAPGVAPSLAFPDGRVLDPKLDGAWIDVEATGCDAVVTVTNAAGQSRTLVNPVWDGRDDAGVYFDTGAATVTATCAGGATDATVQIVRLGIAAVEFSRDEDIAFHKRGLLTREVVPIEGPQYRSAPADAASAIDDAAGNPRPPVAPWEDAMVAPWGAGDPDDLAFNVPAAFVVEVEPFLSVTVADVAISARTGAPMEALPTPYLEVRAVVGDSSDEWVTGEPAHILLDAVQPALGRETRTLTWTWEARYDDTWVRVPGSFTTIHTIWRMADDSALREGSHLGFAPHLPWVGVFAETEAAVTGLPPYAEPVLDALRDHVHESQWIHYDPTDRSYSDYAGEYIFWDYTWVDLSGWLDRDQGLRLYCHSVSCLLSTLAAHLGVYAPQQVLGVGFTTNQVRAAGTDAWGTWGFNSHSVVSSDGGATVWDASIALDGDGDPGALPVTEVAPKGLSFAEYTALLTPDPVEIVNSGLCYFE